MRWVLEIRVFPEVAMTTGDRNGLHWVGVYISASGISINSYLILDEYPTLINTGAPATVELLIKNIEDLIDLKDLQYIVLNQTGVAYAGGLASIAAKAPQARIVVHEHEMFNLGLYGMLVQPMIVKSGDTLNIGKRSLMFFQAPFIGSPNAVFIYETSDRVLFSGEAFSVTVTKWQNTVDDDISEILVAYYDTHIGDSSLARDSIANLNNLAIERIAPGHGPILVKHISKYVEALSRR